MLKPILKSSMFLIVCLIFSITDLSAQKCKFDFDKEDPISSERVRRNIYKLKKQAFTVSYYRKKDEYKLELNILFAGTRNFNVTTSDQLVLKLENGETITVYPSKEFSPVSQATGAGVLTVFAISYNATQEQFELLASSEVTHARSNMGGQSFDVPVKSKMGEKMKQGANCILQD